MVKQSFLTKNKVWIITGLLLLGWFYWFQLQPIIVRKKCLLNTGKAARKINSFTPDNLNTAYRFCLTISGLKPEDLFNEK